jgi:hypothetical protein
MYEFLKYAEPLTTLLTLPFLRSYIMDDYGLSLLKIKHLIERALLPDRCLCDIKDGVLTLNLTNETDGNNAIKITGIKIDGLNNSRAIAYLVGEARYMLVEHNKGNQYFADKRRGFLRNVG